MLDREFVTGPTQYSLTIQQLMLDELFIECQVGFSGPTENIAELPATAQEALKALKLQKQFGLGFSVLNYRRLNLYLFLASLPQSALDRFRQEYGREWQQIARDAELMVTLEKAMEHKLNLSEAARDLFVHRNTLLYRLGKLQKILGLDFKNFDDVVLLRLVMLLNKLPA